MAATETEVIGSSVGMDPALYKAATQGSVRSLRKLVVRDVKILNSKTPQDNTALHLAALHGHAEFAREVLAVSEELMKNNSHVVELLLIRKTELAYSRNKDRQSPRHVAAQYGSTDVIKALLRHCSDVAEMEDGNGRNAFHASIISGNESTIRCLLRHVRPTELLLNRVDGYGDTPLHLAVKMSRVHFALLLLNDVRVVDPCVRDYQGQTARSLVEKKLNTDETDTYEMHLWTQLMQQESKRCSRQQLPPTVSDRRRPLNSKDFDSVVDAYFLAATLIATVTFAATFTMPGGYDQAKGIALHGNNRVFKTFVISNSVAMCSSIVVIFLLIWARQEPAILRLHYLAWSQKLTIVACLAMLLSLMTAVYITVAPTAPWPAYAVIAIGICSPGLFFVISWMGKATINVH
ncbi:hypothetical protein SORBI_3005G172100 [Sorghum bicolor]|uniref:PGG domain-containing protein n=2 Tax=Sorghum bicolor TaxID=4558 RepID=A0A1B6PT40_SORBI|nr:hypothetical protein SORBI_3005G172100 [Sorghum bicolor]